MIAKYDTIGKGYNQTRKADPYLAGRMHALIGTNLGNRYLDVGCGTGNYTLVLGQNGSLWTGIDPSDEMLSIAREKAPDVPFIQASAESIPLPDHSFHGALASLTIHHWDELKAGFEEVFRVLEPGARFVIFTASPEQMKGYWLNAYFPEMMRASMGQMPALEDVTSALHLAGFKNIHTEKYDVKPDLQDHFLYVGKEHPKRYLDPTIRQGISSFSSLANQEEVAAGLIALERDIASGKINSVMNDFRHAGGDYLFISAEK